MLKVKKVEVVPNREKFGIEHRLTVEGEKLENLKRAFERFSSAESFNVGENLIELIFDENNRFGFGLEQPLEEFYTDEVHHTWKTMVAEAMGMEEPFRFYSFYTPKGEHIGTVAFKQDCENFYPIILIYKNF
jgi:hypothetical protein